MPPENSFKIFLYFITPLYWFRTSALTRGFEA
jgi:hypothetical protein